MNQLALRLFSVAAIAAVLAAGHPFSAPTAFACTCGSTMLESAASADIVVVGTVTAWAPTGSPGASIFTPIELDLRVERVLKGNPGETVRFVEHTSYAPSQGAAYLWAGTSGACGTFAADPTGHRALYALSEQPDGTLRAGRCSGTYLGIGVDPNSVGGTGADEYIAQVEAALAAVGLPHTGTGQRRRVPSPIAIGVPAVATAGLALTAGALFLERRR